VSEESSSELLTLDDLEARAASNVDKKRFEEIMAK
jgi:hypothetical protein